MKYNRRDRRKGNDERENEETSRGIIRNQKKIIKRLEQRVKYLQKQLNLTDTMLDTAAEPEAETTIKDLPRKICKKCESNEVRQVTINKPNGQLDFWVCQICHHREKI